MMRQLLSKELMYDPMKQVCMKYPEWLAEAKGQLTDEEYNRYGHQYQYFQRIVAVYETEPDNYPRLMELMSDIQEVRAESPKFHCMNGQRRYSWTYRARFQLRQLLTPSTLLHMRLAPLSAVRPAPLGDNQGAGAGA